MSASFLLAAADLPSGYKRGDPIVCMPYDHQWGNAEDPRLSQEARDKFYLLYVDHQLVTVEAGQVVMNALYDPATIVDPEFNAPDPEDRFIKRHRRDSRVWIDKLPGAVRNELAATGVATISNINQLRSAFTKQAWDAGQQALVDSGVSVF